MSTQPGLSRGRKLAFQAILALFCLALVEIGSLLVLRSMRGEWVFSHRALTADSADSADSADTSDSADEATATAEGDDAESGANDPLAADLHAPRWIIHPFLGFGRNPEAPRQGLRGRLITDVDVNEHGMFGPSPITREQDFNVFLTGGSVALELYLYARTTLVELVEKLPAARGKKVVLVCGALGGMKQPQQLLALNYFLSLGADYDLVINLDGFNEVTLPIAENLDKGVYPFYPRNWSEYAATSIDLPRAAIYGRLSVLSAERIERARRLAASPLRFSYLRLALWEIGRRRLETEIVELEADLTKRSQEAYLTPQQRGPAYREKTRMLTSRHLVEVWSRSSVQIARLAAGSGFSYHHFLQPNQYVEGSKPFSREELFRAVNSASVYGPHAIRGYPLLIAEGPRLREAGVAFHDLTGIFAERTEPLYDDTCCHLNPSGYGLLARAIAARLASDPGLRTAPVDG